MLATVGVLMIERPVVVIALDLVHVPGTEDGILVWLPAALIVRGVDLIAGTVAMTSVGLGVAAAAMVALRALLRRSPVTVEVVVILALAATRLSVWTHKVLPVVSILVGTAGGVIAGIV